MSSPNPYEYKVSGLYLRGVLAGLRKISDPSQYDEILKLADLTKFNRKYPQPDLQTVATGAQLIKLMGSVRERLGPVVFNLFFANLGRGYGRAMATLPQLRARNEELAESPGRIMSLVKYIGELHYMAVEGRVETLLGVTPDTVEIIYRGCIYCVAYPKADAPVCTNVPNLYKQLVLELTGKRVQVEEISCASQTGEGDCHFILSY